MSKENITVYQPKTLETAKMLFEKFKQMNLEHIDEEKFFFYFEKGEGSLGFCIRNNTWQCCETTSNHLFNVTLIEM